MDHQEYIDKRNTIVTEAFEQSDRLWLVVDCAGRIVLGSDGVGVLFGVARAELVGQDLARYFLRPEALDEFRKRWREGSSETGTLEVKHSQGAIRVVEARCRLISAPSLNVAAGDFDRDSTENSTYGLMILRDPAQHEEDEEQRVLRMSKLSLLNQVSEALCAADMSLEQVLQAVLICITSGQGLGFNRAFLLLVDEGLLTLKGELAIGPSNAEEAARIWFDLVDKQVDLFQMITDYDASIKTTDREVNRIVQELQVPLDESENLLIKSMIERRVIHIAGDTKNQGADWVREFLGSSEFALAPLITRRGPLGVIVADNAISGAPIRHLDLEFLFLFANQSAGAIENNRLYRELEKRLIDLRKAHERQKEDQAMLLRMERLSVMGETSAIVAHELRNPLVAIGGFARTLFRGLAEEDPNREFARIISDEVGRMERIIHDLLDFIRPRKQMRKALHMDDLVRECIKGYAIELEENEIELRLDLQVAGTVVNAHPGEIQQVLQNFLMNAIQAMVGGGVLEIVTRVIEGGVRVGVRDSGSGFAKDDVEKLFSPFFSTKTTGSGLGLTICSQIIKSHGGVIGAENRVEGGAEFHFNLPLPK